MRQAAKECINSQFGTKPRHFGMDAEIQAMDGNLSLLTCLNKPFIIRQIAILGRWILASMPE
ncbi:MAG: hypothetical protein DM484_25940 [Candidatus Methylumidiphilus alinenensis]|uniref:Uncharacterized protein n=1 Tax=Candidatus Methylumidiphilus alinenensis TaxID=2202197 RepID=A0A2W4QI78_9GAMM|nr:MAG: hypothetical protein DM484_25940 [Candidatus Methylumidiphilus alinenensis]